MGLLFIGPTRIGDAVLAAGLLDHLLADPVAADGDVTVVCGPLPAPLFEAATGVRRVIAVEKRSFNRHWYRVWRAVAGRRWDLIVDLRNSIIPWIVQAQARAVQPQSQPDEHRVVTAARTLGLEQNPPAPRLWATDAQRSKAAQLMAADRGQVLAIGPAANWIGKIWPAKNLVAALAALTGPAGILPNARIAVFAAADERALVTPILDALPSSRVIDLVGKVDLPTAYACLGHCALYIGHDSGLMHIAAAADIPTLGLFGPSKDIHYAPWGPHAEFVRTAKSYDELMIERSPDRKNDGHLMDSLGVDTVVAGAVGLWQRTQDKKR